MLYQEQVDLKQSFVDSPEFKLYMVAFRRAMEKWLDDRPAKKIDNSRIDVMTVRLADEIEEVSEAVEMMESVGVFNAVVIGNMIEEMVDVLFLSMGLAVCHDLKLNVSSIAKNVDGYGGKSNIFDYAQQAVGEISAHDERQQITLALEHLLSVLISMWKHLPVADEVEVKTAEVFRKNNINHLAIYNQGFHPETGLPLDEEQQISFSEHVYSCLRVLRAVPGFKKHPLFHLLFIEQILDFENSAQAVLTMRTKVNSMTAEQMTKALDAVQQGGQLVVATKFRAWKKWYEQKAIGTPMGQAADTMRVIKHEGIVLSPRQTEQENPGREVVVYSVAG